MNLASFPRVKLAHLPTPIEYLPRLTEYLGGPAIFVKRDDCTGLASGGNKTRKLEFLMADALQCGADTIITQGAVQSNHARQTAAAAARLGLQCELLFENRIREPGPIYLNSGNVFLDRLFGANTHHYPAGTDMNAAMDVLAASLRGQGRAPYVIPGGGSNRIGALGYVDCALELLQQVNQQKLHVDCVVHATGSAGTQAGLVAGLRATHANIPVLGIGVNAAREIQESRVYQLASRWRSISALETACAVKMWWPTATMSAMGTAFPPRACAKRCCYWPGWRVCCSTRCIPAKAWRG